MSFSHIPSRTPRMHWGLSCLVLAVLSLSPQADPPLQPGTSLEREIRIGDVHSYPIQLAAGQFLDAFVEQGIDVKIVLLDPNGQIVATIDSPNERRDVEELAIVAGQPGLYEIRVSVASKKDVPPGKYRLRLAPLRVASEGDRLRMEAVLVTQAVVQQMEDRGPKERQLADREKALALWRKVGDPNREAEELYQIGILQFALGEREKAADLERRAADLWQAVRNPAKQVQALNELGRVLSSLSRSEEALQALGTALSLAREVGDEETLAKILNNRGQLLSNLGEASAALPDLEEALRLTQKTGRCPGSVWVNLGSTYERLGDLGRALDFYKKALTCSTVATGRAAALNNVGFIYHALGNWNQAGRYYTQALELNRSSGDRRSEAGTLSNLALVEERLEQDDKALETYTTALELAQKTGYREAQISILLNLGSFHFRSGRRAEAIQCWEQVPELAGASQDMELRSLAAQAFVQREKGDLIAARATLVRAQEVARSRSAIAWEAVLALPLARLQKAQGDLEAARATAESALKLVESLRSRVPSPDLSASFLGSRQEYYELAIDILMALHVRRPGQGFDAQALQVSERARARSLLDLLSEAGANIQKGADPKLIQLERERAAVVRTRERRHLELIHLGADSQQIAEADRKLQEALDDYDDIQAQLRTSGRLYASLTQPQPLSAADIQQQVLGDRALLLEYALGKEKSYLWAVTSDSLQSFELPGREAIEGAARAFYQAVAEHADALADGRKAVTHAEQQAAKASLELSRLILGKVERLLGGRVLLVVGDGTLQYIPFAALPLPSSPAELVKNEVVALPSASTLAVQRRELAGRHVASKTLAVFADPLLQGHPDLPLLRAEARKRNGTPPHRGPGQGEPTLQSEADPYDLGYLPFSKIEAEKIIKLVPDPAQHWKATGAEASVANVKGSRLKEYRFVHFATHGILDTEHPELSKLALSQFDAQGNPLEDGFLRLQEIYNLDLDADLVVLSACETALGKEIRGEGLIGLTRGFLYAGSSRVLASLWKVEDRATYLLMQRFYHHLLAENRPPAAALRQAQAEIASDKRYSAPYYWAGFSLQGEWR